MNFKLPVSVFREDDVFVAYSPALDLSTSADTFEKAKERFEEIVQLFLEELNSKGTLEEVLFNLGWRKLERSWTPPVLISQETEEFDFKFS